MNTSRRALAVAVLCAAALGAPAQAEVAAETNAFGNYIRTVIYASASVRNPRIWTVHRARANFTPLNPAGDASGDLFPAVKENPVGPRWPWVVWSRYSGSSYDLVWSRWLGTGWSEIAPVENLPSPGDAVDPRLAFDVEGRAYLAWLSRGPAGGRVLVSMFLASQWMAPFQVNDPGEDAESPSIEILADGRARVAYDTPVARVSKIVTFARPATITDDLTPFGTVSATSSSTESAVTKP